MSDPGISVTPDAAARRPQAGRRTRRSEGRGPGGIGISLVLAVSLAGFVAAGWFIAHQQQQLEAAQGELAEADARLRTLEERLRLTDAAMTESGEDTNKQLNFWEAEIRKLWDVSNKRNKGWIEANQKALSEQGARVSRAASLLNRLEGTVDRHSESLKQQDEVFNRLANLMAGQRDMVDKVNVARQLAASLKASLEPKVRDLEEAIRANDVHRRQVNNELRGLGERLATLEQPGASPPASFAPALPE